MCQALGPGKDMFDSTSIIGHNIYLKAKVHYVSVTAEAQIQSVGSTKMADIVLLPPAGVVCECSGRGHRSSPVCSSVGQHDGRDRQDQRHAHGQETHVKHI